MSANVGNCRLGSLPVMKLISIPAAAVAASVSTRTIERWLAEGRLTRYERPGRIRVLVDATELRELVRPRAAKVSGQRH